MLQVRLFVLAHQIKQIPGPYLLTLSTGIFPMLSCFRKPLLFILILSVVTPFSAALGKDEEEIKPIFSTGKKPFVVLNVASVNRLKEEAEFLFETAEYPDAIDAVMEVLDDNVNGLKGLNWDQSAGVMVFLDSVLPPAFEFVAYLPISSTEEFTALMESRQAIMRQETGEEGRYELIAPRGNVQIRIQNDYAFLQLPIMNPDPAFDRELPAPSGFSAALTRQFDMALTLDVEAIPKPTRDLLLGMISSMLSTQHQQRDDEPDAAYGVRDAWQQRDIAALQMIFRDTQRMTLGVNVDREGRGADLDFVLDARDASDLLKDIFLSSTKGSYFTPLIDDQTPVSVSYSAVIADRDKEHLAESVEAAKAWVAMTVEEADLGPIPDESSPLFHALTAVRKTVQGGHLDLFAQFYKDSDDKLAVIGGLRIEDGEAIGAGLQDLLMRVQGMEDIGEIEIGANEHAGISFHRIEFNNPDAGAIELLGSGPGISVGCGTRTAWACVGGDASFDTLKGVMDALEAAYENPVDREQPASVRVVVNFTQLKDLIAGAEAAKREGREDKAVEEEEKVTKAGAPEKAKGKTPGTGEGDGFRPEASGNRRGEWRKRRDANNQIILETLAEGEDRIQADFRPTDKGMRFRLHLDLGFVRAFGRIIGSRVLGE